MPSRQPIRTPKVLNIAAWAGALGVFYSEIANSLIVVNENLFALCIIGSGTTTKTKKCPDLSETVFSYLFFFF